jgi:type I restriction enzyme, S subunit
MSAQSTKPGWKMVKFGDIAQNIAVRIDPAEATTDVYVGLEHLDPETLHLRYWGHPSDVTGQKLVFKKGDVIFGRRRAYQRKLAVAEFDGICSAHAMVVRAKPEMILPEFLPFFLQSDMFMERAIEISVGSLSPTINWKTLRIQKLPLPPIKEQKRIAEILWAADETVEKYGALLNGIKLYTETVIEKNLTSTNSNGALGDYCPSGGIKIGPFGSLLHAKDYQSEGIPVVMPADIEDGVIQEDRVARISRQKAKELNNYRLRENDILFPRRGDLTKRAIVLKHQEGWLCGTGTIRVRVNDEINPRAVFLAVTSASTNRWLDRFSVGTTMPNLNASTIKKIPFHLPQDPSSDAFLDGLERIIDFSNLIKEHRNTLEKLKKTLVEDRIMESATHV